MLKMTNKYMKQTNKIKIIKHYALSLAMGTSALIIALIGVTSPYMAHAASGDAYFSLSPASGSYTIGNSLVLTVSETSASADNVNAVQANLSYPSSLLQFQSISLTGPFTLCGQQTGGSGTVNIGCASTTVVSGTHPVAQITFSVLASGSAPTVMTSGSDIDNNSGVSVWNGVLPSASFTLSQAVTAPPKTTPPSSGSSGSTKSSGSSSSSSSTSSTTTTPTTTTTAPTTASPSLASITVTILSSTGTPIAGAKVTIDKQQPELTNASGVASFSGVNSGAYTVTVTDPGKKSAQTKFSLTAGQNKLVSLKLAGNASGSNSVLLVYIAIIIIVLLLAGGIWLRFSRNRSSAAFPGAAEPNQPVISDAPIELAPLPSPLALPPQPPVVPSSGPTSPDPTIIRPTEPPTPGAE